MHDEIGSGLTRIALMTELMKGPMLSSEIRQNVDEIGGSSRKLVESMSEIIWALNPQQDKLDNLLSYLREQTQKYFEPLHISYSVNFPDTITDFKLSNEQRRNLFLVTKEALNNALKHSGATEISLSAKYEGNKFMFSINDNGKGINEWPTRRESGLRNMQQRMMDIKGNIEWSNSTDGGTQVNYWIII